MWKWYMKSNTKSIIEFALEISDAKVDLFHYNLLTRFWEFYDLFFNLLLNFSNNFISYKIINFILLFYTFIYDVDMSIRINWFYVKFCWVKVIWLKVIWNFVNVIWLWLSHIVIEWKKIILCKDSLRKVVVILVYVMKVEFMGA